MAEERERLSTVRGFPSKRSHQLSALSGAAACVLIIASFLLDLERPYFDDSPAEYAAYYGDKRSQLQVALLLLMFSSFAFAWYFGFLRWLYAGAEKQARGFVRAAPIAFATGITGLAVVSSTGVAQLAAIELVGSIPPSMVRALDLFSIFGTVWGEVLLSGFLLASFFIIRVTGVLPAWLGIAALVGVPVGFFQAVLVLAPSQHNGVFGTANILFFVIFLVFTVGSSVNLSRRTETALLSS